MSKFRCPDCSNEYDKLISLSLHFRKAHNKTAKDLFVALKYKGIEPACKCGCGEQVKFLDVSRGFSDYVWGHASRVNNNWGHNQEAKLKGQKKRKQMLTNGEWKPFTEKATGEHWSKGKTKEIDDRIRKASETRETPEYKKISSQRMRENRLSGVIPTQSGQNHPMWKGGISPLNAYCRSSKKLYELWKYPLLLAAKFQCQYCFALGGNLEVHHDKITFSKILRLTAEAYNWGNLLGIYLEADHPEIQILKEKISETVVEYHVTNKVSGLVLCQECHKNVHKI